MKFYFLSARPCALFLNGAYFGMTDLFERFADVSPKDRVFVEFIPEQGAPVKFFITEELLFRSPVGCETYLLEDGVALYAYDFPPTDTALCVHWQKRVDGCLLTLFSQGRTQLTLEKDGALFVATLPPSFYPTECEKAGNFYLLRSEEAFALCDGEGKILLLEKAVSVHVEEDRLTAVLPLSDRLGRSAECCWSLTAPQPTITAFTLRQETRGKDGVPPADLLPFAFFQSFLIGAETDAFLSDELLSKKHSLRNFLGNFTAVSLTQDPFVLALTYPKGERLFEVKKVKVVVDEGKIVDIQQ